MSVPDIPLAFIQQIGPIGFIVIAIIALLIFGRRLPDVARSLGKGIVEFKKGLRGVEDEIDQAGKDSPPPREKSYSAPSGESGSSSSSYSQPHD